MTSKRIKRGRPQKPQGKARDLLLGLRVNAEEMSFIEAQAAKADMPVSAYARTVLTGRKVASRQTPLEDKMLFELNRCGVNLHQIVRSLNFGKSVPNDIADVLAELHTAIAKVGASYDA